MSWRLQEIVKIFTRKYNLVLKSDAAQWLEQMCDHFELATVEDVAETMETIAKELTSWEDGIELVDVDSLQRAYDTLQTVNENQAARMANGVENIDLTDEDLQNVSRTLKVIDSFNIPRLNFNYDRKVFEKNSHTPSNIGAPESKALFLRDNYNILKQIILRNDHFSPPALPGHDRENYMKLTAIKNLLGRQGQRFLLFGMLTRNEYGDFVLEDLEDSVKLDLKETVPASGLFTEGAFVLVDGEYTEEEVFQVNEIGHPPSEPRHISRSVFGHIDFFGTGALSLSDERKFTKVERLDQDAQFVVISDFHLDNPMVISSFLKILNVYSQSNVIPTAFILCGNFSSKPFLYDAKSISNYTQSFNNFADQVSQNFPDIAQNAHFVLVPGPNDPWDSTSLPRKPLPRSLVGQSLLNNFAHLELASNPCRIIYLSHEIVILRDDLRSRMLRNTVLLKTDTQRSQEENASKESQTQTQTQAENESRSILLERYLVQTILDQATLSPLPLGIRPLIWERAHAMRLYPMPTTLILADKCSPYEVTYDLRDTSNHSMGTDPDAKAMAEVGSMCHVFNPGPFSGSTFAWTTYFPAQRISERSVLNAE